LIADAISGALLISVPSRSNMTAFTLNMVF
jgi:hypothetical protein